MYFPLFVGVLCLSLFWYALQCVLSSFAIILKRKRELVALLLLSYGSLIAVNVLWLFPDGAAGWSAVVIVVFPNHTHLFFETNISRVINAKCFYPLLLESLSRSIK